MVLMHYTINEYVYNLFNASIIFSKPDRIEEVKYFYNKYKRNQENLFFIVSYTSGTNVKYQIGKITKNTDGFIFTKICKEISDLIIDELAIFDKNTYDKDFYYKEFHIEENFDFINKILDIHLSKIKLKYFSWDELLFKNEILFEKISNKIFDIDNVIKLATLYNPDLEYSEEVKYKKYYSALKNLGFINKDGININHPVLHGDIGEFLMHTMVSKFMSDNSDDTYIYPKLVFKTSPKMAVYGNDGTIYVPDKKTIYYLEAKFYSELNEALNIAVGSLSKHNNDKKEDLNYSAEIFRNIKTNRTNELIEVTNDITEKLIIFLMCDDVYEESDVKSVINKNSKLITLKEKFEVIIFVLPILDKVKFLEYFRDESKLKGNNHYG